MRRLTPLLLCALTACASAPRTTTREERVTAMALLSMIESQVVSTLAKMRIAVNESETKPVYWADLYERILSIASALR